MTRAHPVSWALLTACAVLPFAVMCSGGTGDETPTPGSTATATASATRSPTRPTATPSPTATATPLPTAEPATLRPGERAVLTGLGGDALHLRDGPGRSYREVAHVLEGETVHIVTGPQADTDGAYTWWQVELGDGSVGWMAEGPADGSQHWLVPLGSIDPLPFRTFVRSIEHAIESKNVDFFWRTASASDVTCVSVTRYSVYGCVDLPEGAVVSVLPVRNPWEGTSYRDDQYRRLVSGWVEAARPETSDDFGTGAARIYATSPGPPERGAEHYAIMTGILGRGSAPARDVAVFAWQLQDGAWRHTWLYIGEGWWDEGGYPPVSWLNGDCANEEPACIDWQRWP